MEKPEIEDRSNLINVLNVLVLRTEFIYTDILGVDIRLSKEDSKCQLNNLG